MRSAIRTGKYKTKIAKVVGSISFNPDHLSSGRALSRRRKRYIEQVSSKALAALEL